MYHPFSRDGGGTTYSLRCLLAYEFLSQHYDYTLYTTSGRSGVDAARIDEWLPQHSPGTSLAILVNPADPKELAVLETLPIEQFNTSREALITALAFGIAAALLLAVGRAIALSPART